MPTIDPKGQIVRFPSPEPRSSAAERSDDEARQQEMSRAAANVARLSEWRPDLLPHVNRFMEFLLRNCPGPKGA